MTTKPRKGNLGFSASTNLLARLIKFFTRSKLSHSFLMGQDYTGMEMVLEAGVKVQLLNFERWYKQNDDERYVLFELNPEHFSEGKIDRAINKVTQNYLGVQYGDFQLLWFVWRWFCDHTLKPLFGYDARKEKNWFTRGVICSELVYYYLVELGCGDLVKEFNSDTIQAQDLYDIVVSRPDLFKLVEVKGF